MYIYIYIYMTKNVALRQRSQRSLQHDTLCQSVAPKDSLCWSLSHLARFVQRLSWRERNNIMKGLY